MRVLKAEQIERIIQAQDFDVPDGYKDLYEEFEIVEKSELGKLLNTKELFRIELAQKIFNYEQDEPSNYRVNVRYCSNIDFTSNDIKIEVPKKEDITVSLENLKVHIDYTIKEKTIYVSFAFSGKNIQLIIDTEISYKEAHFLSDKFTDIWGVLD